MNFSIQMNPFEEIVNSAPISMALDESKQLESEEKILKKVNSKKSASKLDKKEKISWNNTESKRYLKFLIQFQPLLQLQKKDKRRLKLNVKMSKVIKSRDASQCHSHHQKMLLKFGTVDQIIKSLQYLSQEKITKPKQVEEIKEQEEQMDQFYLEEFALNFNLSLQPFCSEEKQVDLMQMDLMDFIEWQDVPRNSWDDCFI